MFSKFFTKGASRLALSVLTLLTVSGARAQTACLIQLSAPCWASRDPYFAPFKPFADVDLIANVDAGRCMQRAQEYAQWCAHPQLPEMQPSVHSMFVIDARLNLAAFFVGGSTYLYNAGWQYTGFHK